MKTQPKRIKLIQRAAAAPTTLAAYKKDLAYFWAWSAASGRKRRAYPVPVSVVQRFVVEHIEGLPKPVDKKLQAKGVKRAGKHKVGTIRRRLMALSWAHRQRGHNNPLRDDQIKALLSGAKRLEARKGIRTRRSAPITKVELDRMISAIDTRTLSGARARAVLEFAFYTGGRRRSEVAGAHMDFLERTKGGYYYHLNISKTDQTGRGRVKLLRTSRAKGLRNWLSKAGITAGYIFRGIDRAGNLKKTPINGAEVNRIVKVYTERAGLNPAIYSAHGLRRGFITDCARREIPLQDIMAVTDHRSTQQVLIYYEQGAIHRNRATRI
jgi:integrase